MSRFGPILGTIVLAASTIAAGCAERQTPVPARTVTAPEPLLRPGPLPPLAPPLRDPSSLSQPADPPTAVAPLTFDDMFYAKESFAAYPDRKYDEFLPAKDGTILVMTGRFEYVQPSRARKVWSTEDSNHFVFIRDGTPADALPGGMTLRQTPSFVKMEDFMPFAGKRVEIRGRMAGHVKWLADPSIKTPYNADGTRNFSPQLPFGAVDREGYALFGGGLLVDSITVLDEPTPKP